MSIFLRSDAKILNLLFVASVFYPSYTRDLLCNSLNFLFAEVKHLKVSDVSVIEVADNLVSIITKNVTEYRNKEHNQVTTAQIQDLPNLLAKMALDKKLVFFTLRNDKNEEILKFTVIVTSGSLEIPQVSHFFLNKYKNVDGVVALGVIKKGETSHDIYVSSECARGIGQVALEFGVPFTNAIVTADTDELIKERISASQRDVGGRAVKTCLDMISLKRKIETFY